MCPAEFRQVLHIPDVVVVVTGFLPADYGVVQERGDPSRNALVLEFHPAFGEIEFLVPAEASPTSSNERVFRDREILACTVQF